MASQDVESLDVENVLWRRTPALSLTAAEPKDCIATNFVDTSSVFL